MMPRHKRMLLVLGIVAGVGVAVTFAVQAFRSNVMFFFDPTQIAAGEAPADKRFRRAHTKPMRRRRWHAAAIRASKYVMFTILAGFALENRVRIVEGAELASLAEQPPAPPA